MSALGKIIKVDEARRSNPIAFRKSGVCKDILIKLSSTNYVNYSKSNRFVHKHYTQWLKNKGASISLYLNDDHVEEDTEILLADFVAQYPFKKQTELEEQLEEPATRHTFAVTAAVIGPIIGTFGHTPITREVSFNFGFEDTTDGEIKVVPLLYQIALQCCGRATPEQFIDYLSQAYVVSHRTGLDVCVMEKYDDVRKGGMIPYTIEVVSDDESDNDTARALLDRSKSKKKKRTDKAMRKAHRKKHGRDTRLWHLKGVRRGHHMSQTELDIEIKLVGRDDFEMCMTAFGAEKADVKSDVKRDSEKLNASKQVLDLCDLNPVPEKQLMTFKNSQEWSRQDRKRGTMASKSRNKVRALSTPPRKKRKTSKLDDEDSDLFTTDIGTTYIGTTGLKDEIDPGTGDDESLGSSSNSSSRRSEQKKKKKKKKRKKKKADKSNKCKTVGEVVDFGLSLRNVLKKGTRSKTYLAKHFGLDSGTFKNYVFVLQAIELKNKRLKESDKDLSLTDLAKDLGYGTGYTNGLIKSMRKDTTKWDKDPWYPAKKTLTYLQDTQSDDSAAEEQNNN